MEEILIVTGGDHLGGIAEFFGSGKDFGCQVTYRVQNEAGGIAQALSLAKNFVGDGTMCVILGDNIFQESLVESRMAFETSMGESMVMLKEVPDPGRYGVAEVVLQSGSFELPVRTLSELKEMPVPESGIRFHIKSIEEKPKVPKSSFAVTGIYFYEDSVFDVIQTLKPSKRGELEITDVNNHYVKQGLMGCQMFKGWWTDAGTHESYRLANELLWRDGK